MVEECIKTFDPSDTRPIKIWFQDEARFGRINKIAACWAPENVRPVIDQQQVRQYLYVYSVVCPHDGDNYSLILPCVNAAVTSIFFENFSNEFGHFRNIILMDNAPWHTSSLLTKYSNIRFIYLPPYSPELNATEHFWEHMRENYFNNRSFKTLDTVEDALVVALEQARLNTDIIQPLVGFNWIISVNF